MKNWFRVVILIISVIIFFVFQSYYYPSFIREDVVVRGYDMFKDLLTIILAFAGLIVALLGAAMYAWVSRSLDSRVEKKVAEQTNAAAAKLYLNLALISWKDYENKSGQITKGKEGQLQVAIEQSKNALERTKLLDERKFGRTYCLAKNALAYHLGMEGCRDNAERAICLGKYVYDRRWDYDYASLACKFVETYGFVLTKMGDNDQKKKGVEIIKSAIKRKEFPVDLKKYIKTKYKGQL